MLFKPYITCGRLVCQRVNLHAEAIHTSADKSVTPQPMQT